jgi:hypothetical protein
VEVRTPQTADFDVRENHWKRRSGMLKLNNFYTTFVMLAAIWLFAGCSKQESPPEQASAAASAPASTPTPTPAPKWLATTEGEYPRLTAAVQELKRGPNTLMLKLVMINQSDKFRGDLNFDDGALVMSNPSISGVHLIDEANNKKYFVVKDSEGDCICSRRIEGIQPWSQKVLWAQFPAPPDDVEKITVEILHFPPMQDVPISR